MSSGSYFIPLEACPKGHLYSAENTYVWRDGFRRCRTCHKLAAREYAARKRGWT